MALKYRLVLHRLEDADICFTDGAICRVAKQLAVGVNRGLRPGKVQRATMVYVTAQGHVFTNFTSSCLPSQPEGRGMRLRYTL
jgi:hypothetical protein